MVHNSVNNIVQVVPFFAAVRDAAARLHGIRAGEGACCSRSLRAVAELHATPLDAYPTTTVRVRASMRIRARGREPVLVLPRPRRSACLT